MEGTVPESLSPPLISHPDAATTDERRNDTPVYSDEQLTDAGALRLAAHGRCVADRAVRLLGTDDSRTQYLRVAGTLHDFGKATPQFQAHVRDGYDGPEEETYHARLGALATWYVLGQMDAPARDRLAATLAVARHHQALPDAAQYTARTLSEGFEGALIQTQLADIDSWWPEPAAELLQQAAPDVTVEWTAFLDWARSGEVVNELHELSARREGFSPKPASEALPDRLYDRMLSYWAALTLADKSHAIPLTETQLFDPATLDDDAIERYVKDLRSESTANEFEETLNDDRERARRQAIRGVHEWLDTGTAAISTLTLPTGLGKTLTGLSAAFETREMMNQAEDDPSTIVYALPYTSIIEQTRELFEKPELWAADPRKSALTVHHYLSETVVYADEQSEEDTNATDDDTPEFLGEAWRSGTVLTTFVQLFESLTGPSNSQGLKLSTLHDSIIVLDEPQALPKRWWNGVTRLFETLTEEFGAHIIAMTATQPTIIRELESVSLLNAGRNHQKAACARCQSGPSYATSLTPTETDAYYERARRVQYDIDETARTHTKQVKTYLSHETAANRVYDAVRDSGSALAICNTIASSRTLT